MTFFSQNARIKKFSVLDRTPPITVALVALGFIDLVGISQRPQPLSATVNCAAVKPRQSSPHAFALTFKMSWMIENLQRCAAS